jgi:hypothetical protein
MKRPTKSVFVFALIIAGGYLAYLAIFPTYYLRYRLTLDVSVDGVTHTGSGVVEISYQPVPDWLGAGFEGSRFGGRMHGYAITVDLGKYGLLFVVNHLPLLAYPGTRGALYPGAPNLATLPLTANGLPPTGRPSYMIGLVRQLQQKSGPIEIPFNKLPMVLRFRNINDPNSNEEVDPGNLAGAYGPGVQLISSTIEFTGDPISSMPPAWPKWLVDMQGHDGFVVHGAVYEDVWCTLNMLKGD